MSLLSSDFSMKNTLMWLFLVLGSLHTVWAQQAAVSDNAFNTVGFRSLPPLPAGGGKGVSAAFMMSRLTLLNFSMRHYIIQ